MKMRQCVRSSKLVSSLNINVYPHWFLWSLCFVMMLVVRLMPSLLLGRNVVIDFDWNWNEKDDVVNDERLFDSTEYKERHIVNNKHT